MSADVWINYAAAAIRLSAIVLLASLGVLFMARSGILNIGMEGMMLIGALAAVLGSAAGGSAWMGLAAGAAAGCLIGLLFAFLVVTTGADQVIIGTALNLLGLGVTTVFGRSLLGMGTEARQAVSLQPWPVPLLSDLPVVGPLLFQHNALTYLAFLLLPAVSLVLYRTNWGLSVRAVGEHPLAADTLGVRVHRIRYQCCAIGGVLAGLAGAALSIGILNQFTENMVAGRGFIALSAVIFGRWTPGGTAAGSLLFGAADALQLRFQTLGIEIPYQLLLLFPYVLTMLALSWFSGRTRAPAATAMPYKSAANRA
ncbi:ABC transporter permease [Paenibacillus pasadenensis]|uniref:ABC transporter permease n=1 Tax=Paenibacillus pasadenensis TaxID=217090 RepID=UPI0004063198|nr:ABC transporter permease [Paenibacillus pasadenensis]